MKIHPAADIFPLDEEHIVDLAEDIRVNGLMVPIETYHGELLDGRRRLRACEIAGVEPVFREVNPDDPVAYVYSLNYFRRHLTPSQSAMVGAKMRVWYEERAKKRQQAAGKSHGRGKEKVVVNFPQPIEAGEPGKARDDAGKAVKVSGKLIDFATAVVRSGTPELGKLVDSGAVSVSAAAEVAKLPKAEQKKILADGPSGVKKAASESRKQRQHRQANGTPTKAETGTAEPGQAKAEPEPAAEPDPEPEPPAEKAQPPTPQGTGAPREPRSISQEVQRLREEFLTLFNEAVELCTTPAEREYIAKTLANCSANIDY